MASKVVREAVAALAASIPKNQHGSRPWWERVEPQHQELLDAIHAAWYAGELGAKRLTAARGIVAMLAGHGINIGEQGVMTWLKIPPKS